MDCSSCLSFETLFASLCSISVMVDPKYVCHGGMSGWGQIDVLVVGAVAGHLR